MTERNSRWVMRSKEWIKDNPGKGTMYRVYTDDDTPVIPEPTIIKPDPVVEAGVHYMDRLQDAPDAGIYVVICEAEKWAYVGLSKNMGSRLRGHKLSLFGKYKGDSKIYVKMKEHAKKHGPDGFQFVEYLKMPNASQRSLLDKENEVIMEFSKSGYFLYNRAVNGLGGFSIHCPEKHRDVLLKVLAKLTDKSFSVKLTSLLSE